VETPGLFSVMLQRRCQWGCMKTRKTVRLARTFFRQFMEKQMLEAPADAKLLPLAHGTKAIRLRDILQKGKIHVPDAACTTLQEKLIFCFYARPSFRLRMVVLF
jgi:hypothetical protein